MPESFDCIAFESIKVHIKRVHRTRSHEKRWGLVETVGFMDARMKNEWENLMSCIMWNLFWELENELKWSGQSVTWLRIRRGPKSCVCKSL